MEIVSAIGVLERISHNMIGRYTYSGNSEIRNWARNELGVTDNESKTINWGVYTKKQEHTKMLAVALKIQILLRFMVLANMHIIMRNQTITRKSIIFIFGLETLSFIINLR